MKRFASFAEFYPYYLEEHGHPRNRSLHFIGSFLVIALIAVVVAGVLSPWFLLGIPVIGYGFAWIGHFFIEHNKPATFKHPFYSLAGDWVMFFDILRGKVRIG